jgi:hypothetical protein
MDLQTYRSKYRGWHFKNTALLTASLIVFFLLADTAFVKNIITGLGELGYIGAFITGMFFVSTFTVAPAAVVLYHLADQLHPLEIALLAGLGCVVGDYIIFRFLKDKVFQELQPVFNRLGGSYVWKFLSTPYFAWLTPVIGAAIIASPLPDEAGIGLLGLSKIKSWQFLLLSFVLNAVGIFIIVALARTF